MIKKTLLAFLLLISLSCPVAQGAGRVQFGCPALEKAIQRATGSQSVTIEDMRALTGAVDLSGLGITDLSGIEYLENIEALDLSSNQIADITPVTALGNLRQLDASDNRLARLPVDIDLMKSLQTLDISRNPIDAVPRQIADIPCLSKLVMEDCAIRDLPELQPLGDTLKWLSLSGSDLIDYSTLLNLESLELLRLERCSLEVLPDLSLLGNLHYLYVNDNSLHALPAYLGSLPLVRLEAADNSLSGLPDSFASLTGLKQLVLSSNVFTELPPQILAMQSLEVLMMDSNMITSLPPELSSLGNLKRVSFTANDISTLDTLASFNLSSPGQISFDLNRLGTAVQSPVTRAVLARLDADASMQKDGVVSLEVLKADSQSIDLRLGFSQHPNWQASGGELVPCQIRLYSMAKGRPEFLQAYDASKSLKFSYSEDLMEYQSYRLRAVLVAQYAANPEKQLYYYDDVIIYELPPAPAIYVDTNYSP